VIAVRATETFVLRTILVGLLVACGFACSTEQKQTASTRAGGTVVYAANYPLYYFATRIAGDGADVRFAAPPDVDPAFWRPDPSVIADMQKADLILINGAGYEKWLSWVTLPRSRVANTSAAFQDRYLDTDDAITHGHGPAGEHSHSGVAFTTWIDLSQAALQAEAVYHACLNTGLSTPEALKKNFSELRDELLNLDGQIMNALRPARGHPVVASHPVYQYLARRYKLDIRSVLWEPGEPPSSEMWRELEVLQSNRPARWMVWEADPLARTVERLRAAGVRSVVFDPCSNRPEAGDFMSVMRRNVARLQGAFDSAP